MKPSFKSKSGNNINGNIAIQFYGIYATNKIASAHFICLLYKRQCSTAFKEDLSGGKTLYITYLRSMIAGHTFKYTREIEKKEDFFFFMECWKKIDARIDAKML